MSLSIIRPLTLADCEQSMSLSSFAFQFPLTAEQLEERRATFLNENDYRLGVFSDHSLCAQATLLDLSIYINGQLFKMGGIAGVSTWPEHRRHGYVAHILKELLMHMKQHGHTISLLHPFSYGFYRKFGWESYIEYKRYELGAEHIELLLKQHKHTEKTGTVRRLDSLQPLFEVYEQYAVRFNGMLARTEQWWENRIRSRKKGVVAGYYDKQQQLQGYMIYEVLNREMTIHEWISLTKEAEQQLLLYIAQHDSMVDRVTWIAPSDDSFAFFLNKPRFKQEVIPYFMARIVDVESFIQQYRFNASHHDENFTITISDEHAPWNDGIFQLRIASSGEATLTKKEQVDPNGSQISLSIGTLTAWLLNYQKVEVFQRFDHITGNADAMKRLQLRIAERTTYLTDFF